MGVIETIKENRRALGKTLNFHETDNDLVVKNAKQAHKDLKTLIELVGRYQMMYENTGAMFNRMNMKQRIEEQQKEIEKLKETMEKAHTELCVNNWDSNQKAIELLGSKLF